MKFKPSIAHNYELQSLRQATCTVLFSAPHVWTNNMLITMLPTWACIFDI